MKQLILALVFLVISVPALNADDHSTTADKDPQKAVLITGASTGLGRSMAELMASKGYFVYAGARKDKDIEALSAIDNIQGIRLDVTDQAQIDAAVETVSKGGRGLYGLINNAGVGVIYPLIEAPESEVQFQMDVNLFGVYRVTKAFAPMIIESKGRISTTGSISGILSGPMFGVYSMSKHAMEAFTDSLAAELGPLGVHVSIIDPGNYKSDIGKNLRERFEAQGFDTSQSRFPEFWERMLARLAEDNPSQGGNPIEVAEAAMHAMFAENPKRRYMVVPNQQQAQVTVAKAIEEAVQLNQGHQYSYNREQMIEMLDKAMEANP